jgi:hypothetical protein
VPRANHSPRGLTASNCLQFMSTLKRLPSLRLPTTDAAKPQLQNTMHMAPNPELSTPLRYLTLTSSLMPDRRYLATCQAGSGRVCRRMHHAPDHPHTHINPVHITTGPPNIWPQTCSSGWHSTGWQRLVLRRSDMATGGTAGRLVHALVVRTNSSRQRPWLPVLDPWSNRPPMSGTVPRETSSGAGFNIPHGPLL